MLLFKIDKQLKFDLNSNNADPETCLEMELNNCESGNYISKTWKLELLLASIGAVTVLLLHWIVLTWT